MTARIENSSLTGLTHSIHFILRHTGRAWVPCGCLSYSSARVKFAYNELYIFRSWIITEVTVNI